MRQVLRAAVLVAGIVAMAGGGACAETVTFNAKMSGAAEVPPKSTPGQGTATASLDTTTRLLTYNVQYSELTGPATAAHFHGPAEPGANAGVVLKFDNTASPINGTATLTESQAADLTAGKWYANVHTAANPGGEIRGQMVKGN